MAYEVTVLGRQAGNSAAGETINEISGYAHSRRHSSLIWAHEDTGGPYIYGFGHNGAIRHIIRLTGSNVLTGEWEDICFDDANGYIWVARCGNNNATRDVFQAYRVTEPSTLSGNVVVDRAHSGAFQFGWTGYENGGRNCETMLCDQNGRLYFVNKETSTTGNRLSEVGMWRAPATLQAWPAINWLTRVTPNNWLAVGGLTGGDWARDNHAIYLMNNNDNGWKMSTTSPGFPLIETFTVRPPTTPGGTTPTAESLCVSTDSTFLIRGSEGGQTEILRVALGNSPPPVTGPHIPKRGTATLAVKRA